MNILQHLVVSGLIGACFLAGAAAINLVDLDHRCATQCSLKDYLRVMLKGSIGDNDLEVERLLERGSLHSMQFLLVVWSLAATFTGAAFGLTLHYLGDGL